MLKFASETLLEVADQIEREAAEKSIFGCSKCAHTISLSDINSAVKTASDKAGVKVASVLVDDCVACTECEGGQMAYQASDESDRYYEEVSASEEVKEEEVKEASIEIESGLIDKIKGKFKALPGNIKGFLKSNLDMLKDKAKIQNLINSKSFEEAYDYVAANAGKKTASEELTAAFSKEAGLSTGARLLVGLLMVSGLASQVAASDGATGIGNGGGKDKVEMNEGDLHGTGTGGYSSSDEVKKIKTQKEVKARLQAMLGKGLLDGIDDLIADASPENSKSADVAKLASDSRVNMDKLAKYL